MGSSLFKDTKLVGSKLKTLEWPNARTVVNNIRSFFEGRDLKITLKVPANVGFHPMNNFGQTMKTYLVSKYDVPIF